MFWWTAMVFSGTSVSKLLGGVLWTALKFPADGNADEDQNSCPFLYIMAPRQSQKVAHCFIHMRLQKLLIQMLDVKTFDQFLSKIYYYSDNQRTKTRTLKIYQYTVCLIYRFHLQKIACHWRKECFLYFITSSAVTIISVGYVVKSWILK